MAFLTLLGITVPTSTSSSGAIEPVRMGEFGRTFSNKPYSAVRAESKDYRGSTPFMPRRTSVAHQLLVAGAGEAFPFDAAGSGATTDYYSTKGTAPHATVPTFSTFATGGAVGNGGRLSLAENASIAWRLPASPLSEATFSCWVQNPSASSPYDTWTHVVVESAGASAVAAWVNGASASTGSLPFNMASWATHPTSGTYQGYLAWIIDNASSPGGDGTDVAEAVVLPFRASLLRSDWASYMYNSGSGRAVEDLPYLSMGGTWVPPGDSTQTDEVLGEVLGQRLADTTVSGSTVQYEAFDFLLRSRNVR